MRRREFIAGLGGAMAWPLAAWSQREALPVIGFLSSSVAGTTQPVRQLLPAFRQGLKDIGYFEGQNVAIEYRWAAGQYDRLPALAADLVGLQLGVIYATDNAATQAAKLASSTIPIVFTLGADPVKLGLVASLARPGGNVTGVTFRSTITAAIRVQMLHEAVPNAAVVGALINPSNPNAEANTREIQEAARTLGVELHVLNANTERELDAAFATLIQRHVEALFIDGDPFFAGQLEYLAALQLRHAIPAISDLGDFADAGGLMSYGASIPDIVRQAGIYVGRVLKGEKPADLPVVQPTRFQLLINLTTAKAIGLEVPPTLLALADEVIE